MMQMDMRAAIIPKSDQTNSDDLIAGPITIKVTRVDIRPGTEQPVSIFFEGDSGKPYKPCKTCCRIMVAAWGPDAKNYIGRSMTLYRDPAVKWGGMEVGGIRISHMSDLEKTLVLALTATKGSRKPYTVKPIAESARGATPSRAAQPASDAPTPQQSDAGDLPEATIEAGRHAAFDGIAAYEAWFIGQTRAIKTALVDGGHHASNKALALKADQPPADDDDFPGDR